MFIKNKKSGVVQECHNKDVIHVCQKDIECYEVTETKPVADVEGEAQGEGEPEAKSESLEEMTVSDLKAMAKEKGLEGYSGLSKAELLELLKDVV